MGREARAHQLGPVYLGVPFTKVDAGSRTVTGIVSDEVLDRQNEVTDFDTIKAFLTDEKLWPGNIREQHDPKKPVGSKIEVVLDEIGKVATLTAYVSEACPDTWTKCLDRTLKGFSIGGSGRRVVEKMGDRSVTRLYMNSLAEVSLVDNPANPHAFFAVAKSVDGQMVDVEPLTAAEIDQVSKATDALDEALEVEKAKKDDGEKNKTASGDEGKWYAGTDGKSFPISTAKDVSNAARALGRTTQDKAKVKANIIRIAYAHGLESGLPDAWKKSDDSKKAVEPTDVVKAGPEPYDIDSALTAISFVNRLMAGEYWEARYATPGASDGQKAQIAMLKAACDALLDFLQAEYEEQFQPDAGGALGSSPLDLSDVIDLDDTVELFTKALSIVQKAGARHSKSDVDMIQKVHDLSSDLGANCDTRDDNEDTEKAAKACATCKGTGKIRGGNVTCPDCKGAEKAAAAEKVADAPPAADSEPIQKLTGDLETTKTALTESQATVAKQAETLAAFEARLKTLEDSPAAGGPVRSAAVVDKSLGTPTEETGTSADTVVKALQALATSSENPVIKEAAAMEILKFQTRAGTNRLALRPDEPASR